MTWATTTVGDETKSSRVQLYANKQWCDVGTPTCNRQHWESWPAAIFFTASEIVALLCQQLTHLCLFLFLPKKFSRNMWGKVDARVKLFCLAFSINMPVCSQKLFFAIWFKVCVLKTSRIYSIMQIFAAQKMYLVLNVFFTGKFFLLALNVL